MNTLMSYVALARKWRPRTFSELIGQHHITKALMNSLHQQRLHHAYLFTGTRGVGKTSVARLLAKALNCEQGIQTEPCLQCDTCLAIEQGRLIDLIEIDGASRTRIEDTRDLLDNVQYAPTSARFKIYLIDEVHMLSQHSFNALLKTLEEPPAHVKFLLATTDPQKLPLTVLSRCLQFNLKHLEPTIISQHLEHILAKEHYPYDKPAVDLLAKAARGSMRDALSLLDHAIACSDEKLQTDDVKTILGYTQQDYALQLLHALATLDPQTLITISRQIAMEGGHFHHVAHEMLAYLHRIAVHQAVSNQKLLTAEEPDIQILSTQLTPEDVQLLYQINLKGADELPLAPSLSIGFDMMLLRMYVFRPAAQQTLPLLAYQTKQQDQTVINEALINQPIDQRSIVPEQSQTPPTLTPSTIDHHWNTIVPKLKLTGLALTAAEQAEWVSKLDTVILLRVAKGHQSMFTPTVIKRIEDQLANYYQEKIKLAIESSEETSSSPAQQREETQKKIHQNAEAALQNDPFFQQLQKEFSAEVVKNSIEPV